MKEKEIELKYDYNITKDIEFNRHIKTHALSFLMGFREGLRYCPDLSFEQKVEFEHKVEKQLFEQFKKTAQEKIKNEQIKT